MPRILPVALVLAAVLLACASANKISVTSWCPVTIIGKCPGNGCPAPQQVVLNYGDVRYFFGSLTIRRVLLSPRSVSLSS